MRAERSIVLRNFLKCASTAPSIPFELRNYGRCKIGIECALTAHSIPSELKIEGGAGLTHSDTCEEPKSALSCCGCIFFFRCGPLYLAYIRTHSGSPGSLACAGITVFLVTCGGRWRRNLLLFGELADPACCMPPSCSPLTLAHFPVVRFACHELIFEFRFLVALGTLQPFRREAGFQGSPIGEVDSLRTGGALLRTSFQQGFPPTVIWCASAPFPFFGWAAVPVAVSR